ncbi:uncharacterized protein LOC130613938 isoform X3 [Hydractinia symbiolongicarpus]|nr:uncharacterized protein LOC130613938 isoform X3 [Hydractinia symbiolongicarpus]
MYTNGVSLKDIVSHIKSTLGLNVSKSAVHYLMRPRRKKTTSSKRHKSLVDARVPPKRNTGEKKIHEDFHFSCSQVNLVNELAQLCNENTISLSVDNKNKVDVGIPATSRRAQIRRYHIENEAPIYNDHDFPYPNSKLTPAGYQQLKVRITRSRSLSPTRQPLKINRKRSLSEGSSFLVLKSERTKDKVGRSKIKWSRKGPLFIHLYPSRLVEATNVMHVNYLLHLLQQEKKIKNVYNVVAIADGGPDWSTKAVVNLMSLGYLWLNLRLDCLIVQCYAPGHSRFNPIERCWSFLTQQLVGVTLPVEVDGKTPNPNDSEKWLNVLDNAATVCSKFWNNKIYDGFPIKVETFLSTNPLLKDIKCAHDTIKRFCVASRKSIKSSVEFTELQQKYRFFVKHCTRKAYQIEFVRCTSTDCDHCSSLPLRKNQFLDVIREFGGTCPTPQHSDFFAGHYKTLIEMVQSQLCRNISSASRIMPCLTTKYDVCNHGCRYAFFSEADKTRHMRLMDH